MEFSPGLKRACRIVQLLLIVAVLAGVAVLVFGDVVNVTIDRYWDDLDPQRQAAVTYDGGRKTWLASLSIAAFAAPVLIIAGAFRLFGVLAKGDVFSAKVVASVRFLGLTIIGYGVARILFGSGMYALLTYGPDTLVKLAVTNEALTVIITGLVVWTLGYLIGKAQAVAEENRQFV